MDIYRITDHEVRLIADTTPKELLWTLHDKRPPDLSKVSGILVERLPPEDRITIDGRARTVAEWAAEADAGEVLMTEARPALAAPFGAPGLAQP